MSGWQMARRLVLPCSLMILACGGRVSEPSTGQPASGVAIGGSSASTNLGRASTGVTSIAGDGATASYGGASSVTEPVSDMLTQDPPCEDWALELPLEPIDAYWVVDASASMATLVPGKSRSRWEIVRDKLDDCFASTKAADQCSSSRVGVLIYPGMPRASLNTQETRDSESCVDLANALLPARTEFEPLGTPSDAQRLIDSVVPMGNTPTLDAYRSVVQAIPLAEQTRAAVVVLVTDGMPSMDAGCTDPAPSASVEDYWLPTPDSDTIKVSVEPILEAIEAAHARGIRTVVIGAPGSEDQRNWLSQAAVLGGSPLLGCDPSGEKPNCHLDMTVSQTTADQVADPIDFASVYRNCRFELPKAGPKPTNHVDSKRLTIAIQWGEGATQWLTREPAEASDCWYGYRLIGSKQGELCAGTCELLREDCSARLQLTYGCKMPAIGASP